MIISETTILWLCFLITFGFLGFKLAGFVKKMLDNYILNIDKKINDSENLKIKAINTFEEAKNDLDALSVVLDKNNKETDAKIAAISKKFEDKVEKSLSKLADENEKQMQYEKKIIIDNAKTQMQNIISSLVKEILYKEEDTDENKTTIMKKSIVKVEFKKLLEN